VDFVSILMRMRLFAELPEPELAALASFAETLSLPAGGRLYGEGDSPEYFYVVVSGRLRVTSHGSLLGYVSRFEPVGEMGIVTGEPRTANVHATRDTLLARIARRPFLDLLTRQGPTLLSLARMMLGRVRQYQQQHRAAAMENGGAFAVIPASPGVPAVKLAEALVRRLSGWPQARLITARHVDAALGDGAAEASATDADAKLRLMGWLNQLEGLHRYLVYAAESDRDPWALQCARHADRVLVVAESSAEPSPLPSLGGVAAKELLAPIELVLLRPDGDPSPHTLAWRERTGARAHYFLHPWHSLDLDALARQVTARGVGLVLGGGGARGFAHIGLVRALEELEIPVDVMGGTSMGAFIAALLASGFGPVEMAQIARETFVNANYLNDYTLPRMSLIRGQKFLGRLREVFGENRIEDLRRTCFCISTSLTTGAAVVHDRGQIAPWVGTSMAVPGVVPPVAYQGELLCDGGVIDNLPTGVMQGLERGSIVACSVSAPGDIRAPGAADAYADPILLLQWTGQGLRPRFGEILLRTATLTSDTLIQRQAVERADVHIRMPVSDVSLFSWKRLDELVARGYQHALAELTPLRDTLIFREKGTGSSDLSAI
jgi:NTE family protein